MEEIKYKIIPENTSNIGVLSFHLKLSLLKLSLQIKHKLLKSIGKETDDMVKEVLKTVAYVAYSECLVKAVIDEIFPPDYEIKQHQVIVYENYLFFPSWVDKSEIKTPCKLGFISRTDRLLS